MGVSDWLPEYDIGHRYEVVLPLEPAEAVRVALRSPAAPDLLVRALFRLRGFRPHGSLAEFFEVNGFTVLEDTPTSHVVGILAGYSAGTDVRGVWRSPPPAG